MAEFEVLYNLLDLDIEQRQRIRSRRYPPERVYKQTVSFLVLPDSGCIQRFRINKQTVADLCSILSFDLEPRSRVSTALPVAVKVTAALFFYATGTFQTPVSDIAGMSQSCFSRCLHQVNGALLKVSGDYIRFPETRYQQEQTKRDFFNIAGFPKVLGAIDCTHVQIRTPSENAVIYINRKGFPSLNVQVVCDAKNIITNVFAYYPGSCHDSFILSQSSIARYIEGHDMYDSLLIGDNGYSLKKWLMTPVLSPQTAGENAYNEAHRRTRSAIESTFGMLKMRFRCLDRSGGALQYSVKKVAEIFVACCVLHNIATTRGCLLDISETRLNAINQQEADFDEPVAAPESGRNVRNIIIAEHFTENE
ncbi:putative nuclease HARBI1 isoform X1 [Huso huso]|uniref:Putative nuclease HARBI1 n=1 Tax=Huso huso TaxID=61971 RepID=A0ABR0YQ57_HUSHU